MPVRYFIDEEQGFLIGEASGIITDQESIKALSDVVQATGGAALFKPHLYRVDPNTLLHKLSFEGIVRIKDNFVAWTERYPGRDVKTAFVVPDAMHAMYARLWQALSDAHREIGSTVELFDTEAEAVAWLQG